MTKGKNKVNFWERNRLSNGYLLQKRLMAVGVSIVRAILLFGLCFLILQPILQKISVSFMEEQDLYNPIVINIPEHFTTENYKLCADPRIMDYTNGLKNSLIISFTKNYFYDFPNTFLSCFYHLYMTIRLIINSLVGVPLFSDNTYELTQKIKKEDLKKFIELNPNFNYKLYEHKNLQKILTLNQIKNMIILFQLKQEIHIH